MMAKGMGYTVAAAVVAGVVMGVGRWWGGEEAWSGVVWGAGAAFVVQVGVFWVLFVWLLRDRRGIAHAVGAMVRFAAVAVMAFGGLGALELAPVPTLFSMVACLFGATLLEAFFLGRDETAGAPAGPATMRTQS